MESEITIAIKEMKNHKVKGINDPGEFVKILGQEAMKVLIDLCRNTFVTGTWPLDLQQMKNEAYDPCEKNDCNGMQGILRKKN